MKKLNSFQSLGRQLFLIAGVAAFTFMASCTTEADMEPLLSIDDTYVEADLLAEGDFEEIDDIVSNMMEVAEFGNGGKIENNKPDERCGCADVTHDKEAQTIIIDFGEGCTGPNGITRSGAIIITYDGHRFVPGSSWITTFRDFYVNDRHIEGTRTVTNISESIDAEPTFHITLVDGKVTWPDETFATREVDRVRVWKRADNPLLDEFHILPESTANGVNREEIRYSTIVIESLVYKRMCRGAKGGRIPVAGVKDVTYGERVFSIDFGDGECDTIVTITSGDETKTVDLSDR